MARPRRSDQDIIQFIAQSPVRSIEAMRDILRYLDENWIQEDLEHELWGHALGDSHSRTVSIKMPAIKGTEETSLFMFLQHASNHHLIRRRPRTFLDDDSGDTIVFYNLTSAGRRMVGVLDAIQASRN